MLPLCCEKPRLHFHYTKREKLEPKNVTMIKNIHFRLRQRASHVTMQILHARSWLTVQWITMFALPWKIICDNLCTRIMFFFVFASIVSSARDVFFILATATSRHIINTIHTPSLFLLPLHRLHHHFARFSAPTENVLPQVIES